ncbi:MAG: hypothetical protein ABSD38_06260 [Syntrophorhabdales bacterium]|jgi:hypothetical protein
MSRTRGCLIVVVLKSERTRNDAGSPTIMGISDPGKPFEVFMADDSICRPLG